MDGARRYLLQLHHVGGDARGHIDILCGHQHRLCLTRRCGLLAPGLAQVHVDQHRANKTQEKGQQ